MMKSEREGLGVPPVERKKPRWKSKSGLKKESGRWRPTTRQVFWAIGMVVTLTTIVLLVVQVVQLYPGLWADVSREPVATLLGIGVALMVLIVLLAMGSAALGWTGFRGKTLWDVLQLLIVPFALAVIGILFTIQQNARQEQIENQRAKVDREIEDTRAEQALLQSYLDQMGALLLDRNLRAADEDSNVHNVARARTLTTLAALNDPRRKQKALRFFKVLGRDAVNTGQPTEWRAGYQPQLRGVARC
jgi:hypothetical protein